MPKPTRINPLFLAILSIFILHNVISACKCSTPSQDVAFSRSDIVFKGRVESVWPKLIEPYWAPSFTTQTYKFRVFRIWKGEIEGDSIVLPITGSNCDYLFKVGQTYLVYAASRGPYLNTSICDRTNEAMEATEDMEALGTGRVVADPSLPFVPESKIRRFYRHFIVYLFSGVSLAITLVKEDIHPGSFWPEDRAPYSLFALHFLLLLVLFASSIKIFHKKLSAIILLSVPCFLFSIAGNLFWSRSPYLAFCLNLLILILFSIYNLIRARFRIALCFFILGLFFTALGLLVFGYHSLSVMGFKMHGWSNFLLA